MYICICIYKKFKYSITNCALTLKIKSMESQPDPYPPSPKTDPIESEKPAPKNESSSPVLPPPSSEPISNAPIISSSLKNLIKAQAEKKKGEESKGDDMKIEEAYMGRKKDSYFMVKSWDDKRTMFMNTHRNLIEGILIKMEKKMLVSQIGLQAIVQFFRERASHEAEYVKAVKSKTTKLSLIWKEGKEKEEIAIYPGLSKAFSEIDDMHVKKANGLNDFVFFLEKNIIRDLLLKDQDNYERRIGTCRDKITSIKKKLIVLNSETIDKSSKYSKLYNDTTVLPQKVKDRKDLYLYELHFLKSAFDQIKTTKKLAHEILEIWQETLKCESIRLEAIKKSFQSYLARSIEVYGKSNSIEIPLKILEIFDEVKETENQFQISKILTNDELIFIKKHLGVNDISLKELKLFFEEFEIIQLPQKPLVKREIPVLRDVGGFTKNFKQSLFIITLDGHLIIQDISNENEIEIVGCLKIENLSIIARKEVDLYDLIEKVPGFIFDTTNKFLIKMTDGDKLDELCHYLNLKR